jgi:hypothetical protein
LKNNNTQDQEVQREYQPRKKAYTVELKAKYQAADEDLARRQIAALVALITA